jgi:hypothetical protein
MKKRSTVTAPTGVTLTVHQAHELIGKENITVQGLYLAVERGDFPSIRVGKKILILRAPFEEFLKGSYGTPKHTYAPRVAAKPVERSRPEQTQPDVAEDFLHADGY